MEMNIILGTIVTVIAILFLAFGTSWLMKEIMKDD
jgi:hypothetical protein